MAEQDKLNAISKAWTQPEKEAFSSVASGRKPKAPVEVLGRERKSYPLNHKTYEEPAADAAVPAMQAANLEAAKADPSVQSRLNMVARELQKMRARKPQ
jgi:hypothetical protein